LDELFDELELAFAVPRAELFVRTRSSAARAEALASGGTISF
jgi:hypothetical protein